MAKVRHDPSARGWRSGISLVAVLVGCYVVFASCDHFWFFRDAVKAQAGVAASILLPPEIKCSTNIFLVRMEKNGARYRCPIYAMYGAHDLSPQPFVPWPNYTEGVSIKLKQNIDDVMANSARGEEILKKLDGH